MAITKLFCIPYAGGSSITYLNWRKWLSPQIELHPIELAGRRNRLNEPYYTDVAAAVEDIFLQIEEELDCNRTAFFGHSMGTILLYELLRKLQSKRMKEPVHLFFSGRFPPFVEMKSTAYHLMNNKEFISIVSSTGGTIKELFQNPELLELFLPVLRNDYKLVETYSHNHDILQLSCPISVLHGKKDHLINKADMKMWQKCTTASCSFQAFDGNHFFINSHREEIIKYINMVLDY